jgi:SpoVK/Ycf46/Vps4 family AAA+-type ATPase
MSNGYVGSDIVAACLMAFTLSQRRRLHSNSDSSALVTENDFFNAVQMTKPSQLGRDLGMPLFPISDHDEGIQQSSLWDRLGGLCETKQRLDRLILLPMRNPTLLASSGSQAPHALLLYGPPGTGKTSLAKAIAQRAGAHFVSLNLADLLKSEVGESEKVFEILCSLVFVVFCSMKSLQFSWSHQCFCAHVAVRRALCSWTMCRRCCPNKMIVLYVLSNSLEFLHCFAYIVSSTQHLAKVRAQLFFEMDRLALNPLPPSQKSVPAQPSDQLLPTVIVLAATNRPDLIDPSLVLRGGRFSEAIFVPLPTESERQQILRTLLFVCQQSINSNLHWRSFVFQKCSVLRCLSTRLFLFRISLIALPRILQLICSNFVWTPR